MSEAALSIKSVDKIYEGRGKGPVHAVKTLDMDVQRGEIVALLGSSGCGKTSTLRMIAGFEEVTRGDIVLEGRRVNQMPPARRKVAMAFEGYSLYPPLTVRDNIAFALKSARMSPKDARESRWRMSRTFWRSSRSSIDIQAPFRAESSSAQVSLARSCVRRISISWTNPWASSSLGCAPSCEAG